MTAHSIIHLHGAHEHLVVAREGPLLHKLGGNCCVLWTSNDLILTVRITYIVPIDLSEKFDELVRLLCLRFACRSICGFVSSSLTQTPLHCLVLDWCEILSWLRGRHGRLRLAVLAACASCGRVLIRTSLLILIGASSCLHVHARAQNLGRILNFIAHAFTQRWHQVVVTLDHIGLVKGRDWWLWCSVLRRTNVRHRCVRERLLRLALHILSSQVAWGHTMAWSSNLRILDIRANDVTICSIIEAAWAIYIVSLAHDRHSVVALRLGCAAFVFKAEILLIFASRPRLRSISLVMLWFRWVATIVARSGAWAFLNIVRWWSITRCRFRLCKLWGARYVVVLFGQMII